MRRGGCCTSGVAIDGLSFAVVDLETTGFSPRLFSARLHELIKGRPGGAPASKAALLPALAGMLDGKDELPQALIEVFEDLIRVTSLP